jgi:hypothetical protein
MVHPRFGARPYREAFMILSQDRTEGNGSLCQCAIPGEGEGDTNVPPSRHTRIAPSAAHLSRMTFLIAF